MTDIPLDFTTNADQQRQKIRMMNREIEKGSRQASKFGKSWDKVGQKIKGAAGMTRAGFATARAGAADRLGGLSKIGGTAGGFFAAGAEAGEMGGVAKLAVSLFAMKSAVDAVNQAFNRASQRIKEAASEAYKLADATRKSRHARADTLRSQFEKDDALRRQLMTFRLTGQAKELAMAGVPQPGQAALGLQKFQGKAGGSLASFGNIDLARQVAQGLYQLIGQDPTKTLEQLSPEALERARKSSNPAEKLMRELAQMSGLKLPENLEKAFSRVSIFQDIEKAKGRERESQLFDITREGSVKQVVEAVYRSIRDTKSPEAKILSDSFRTQEAQLKVLQQMADNENSVLTIWRDFTQAEGSLSTQAQREANKQATIAKMFDRQNGAP